MFAKLTRAERCFWWWLLGLAVVGFVAFIAAYLIDGLNGGGKFPFVANAVAKDALFLAITVIILADIRRFGWMTLLVIYGHLVLIGCLGLMLATGNASDASLMPFGSATDGEGSAWIWLGADVFVVALTSLLYVWAQRSRPDLRYLSPLKLATVRAVAEVLIPDSRRRLDPDRIAHNADVYLGAFHAKTKYKVKVAVGAMLPLAVMNPRRRRSFMMNQLKKEGSWFGGRWLRKLTQPVIGVGAQLVYLAYYGDRATSASIGYRRFKDRPGAAANIAQAQLAQSQRDVVKVMDPNKLDQDALVADVVIVGSGAAGSILAYELAKSGKYVLVLERGQHIDPARFNDTETDMLSKLYSDGAIQVSRDLRFAVLQGMCVGGSTVVNNAVCIRAPDHVLNEWNDPTGLNAGLDLNRLSQSFDHIGTFMNIQPQQPSGRNTRKFRDGATAVGLGNRVETVHANIADCLQCGNCNIGCEYGAKLSMLSHVLPAGQNQFGDRLRILADCDVQRLEMDGPRAVGLRCKLGDGRTVRVRAKERYVVSAGAIASSLLLQRSGIRRSAAGRDLSFNMATPLTALFDDGQPMNSYAELQISRYVVEPNNGDYALETWFNPPGMQSLFTPGWGEEHFENMLNYAKMGCAGVVVGTKSVGSVRRGISGDFGFTPDREDLEKLISGAKQLTRMFLAAGAKKVMPSTLAPVSFGPNDSLDRFDHYIDHPTGISLNSAHPQGGNVMCRDQRRGVVDSSFRVHELDNVYVCDASVFPSSITVNPQWTVMALAHYAASDMVAVPVPRGPRRLRADATRRFGTRARGRPLRRRGSDKPSEDQPAATDST